MSQSTYNFFPAKGSAGGIVDLAPYAIDSRCNEENDGVLKFGIGVVEGTAAGNGVKLPATGATADTFEGIVVNNRVTEFAVGGAMVIKKGATVGVMRYGRVYARVKSGVTVAYGDKVHLIISGTNAGLFTNTADTSTSTTIEITARFLGAVDARTGVAEIELFNAPQVVPAED